MAPYRAGSCFVLFALVLKIPVSVASLVKPMNENSALQVFLNEKVDLGKLSTVSYVRYTV